MARSTVAGHVGTGSHELENREGGGQYFIALGGVSRHWFSARLVRPAARRELGYERITLLEIWLDLFGVDSIQCLCGDREFVGKVWFTFLQTNRIPFQMRLKKSVLVKNGRGQFVPAWRLFATTRINHVRVIPEARPMWGLKLYLSGCQLQRGEWLILVSAEYEDHPAQQYRQRWGD